MVKGSKYKTKPCTAFLISEVPNFGERGKKIRDERHGPTSWASITLNEGKFRQVRKMTSAVGFPTLRLIRVRIGNVYLNDLKSGEVNEIAASKILNLKLNVKRYTTQRALGKFGVPTFRSIFTRGRFRFGCHHLFNRSSGAG